jgi:alanine racemase
MSNPGIACAILTIDLDAIADNYRQLRDRLNSTACSAVVKADAYGLSIERVAPALARAGCESFFVAQIEEGITLRKILPNAAIHILNGLLPRSEEVFAEHHLIPVLNSVQEIDAWTQFRKTAAGPPAALHVDTGMTRLGIDPREAETLAADRSRLAGLDLALVMSHLTCAEQPDSPLNRQQLETFRAIRSLFGSTPASLANSSGIFLGSEFHFNIARPGGALFGIKPQIGTPNPMAQVIRLQGKILQVRDIDSPRTVGYGATHRTTSGGRIATVAVGYADGYLRSLSNAGGGYIGGIRVPVVGRVSMDLITLDVTDVPTDFIRPGALVDLIGPDNPLETVAREAGTNEYEMLTALGSRYHRVYKGGA